MDQDADSSAAASDLVAEKIKFLLSRSSSESRIRQLDERRLIALILMTRLPNHLFDTLYQDLFKDNSNLLTWILQLIKEPCQQQSMHDADADDEEESVVTNEAKKRLHETYIRFAAILLERITNSDPSFAFQLGMALTRTLELRTKQIGGLRVVDVEVLSALREWISSLSIAGFSKDYGNSNVLWQVCQAITQRWLGSMMKAPGLQISEEESTHKNQAEQLMAETLERVLLQRGEEGTLDITKVFAEDITELLIQCFKSIDCGTCNTIPPFFTSMLDFWVGEKKNSGIDAYSRTSMARVLLFYIKHMAYSEAFKVALTGILSQNVIKVILACIMSYQKHDQLHAAAWSTLTTLLETNGWEWLLINPNTTLKDETILCSISRLAAGEWRIQLGLLLADEGTPPTETGLLLLQACGQVIMETLQFMIHLAAQLDNDDEEKLSFSGESILRIRSSLEESLNGAIQYIGCSIQRHVSVDIVVVRVLSSLLAEFDVFEQQRRTRDFENPKEYIQENDALQALSKAVRMDDVLVKAELLPALAAVFASSEGDSTRISQLKEYGLLGNEISRFFQVYWRGNQNIGSIPLACEVIAIWISISGHIDLQELKKAVLTGIETIIGNNVVSQARNVALSTAISCYVTLQGDTPPPKADASIIQRAAMLLEQD